MQKGGRGYGFVDEERELAVKGIPYCAEHKDDVQVNLRGVKIEILFRSHAYRNAFRKLNNLA